MKQIFDIKIKIRLSAVITFLLLLAVIVSGIYYYKHSSTVIGMLMGSLSAGLIVAFIQWIISKKEFKQTEKIEDLELVKILYDRDDRTYYANLIDKSRREIRIMGVTAKRFFEHFADMTVGARPDAQVLIMALNRGVKVKLLLPSKEYIAPNKKVSYEQVEDTLKSIKSKYPHAEIDIRYFNHIPAHSIFMVDGECIVGPVFDKVESKNTPALHLKKDSPFAEKYVEYFEQEWEDLNE